MAAPIPQLASQVETSVNRLFFGGADGGGIINDQLLVFCYMFVYIWVNYNELTTSSLEIIVSKGNHPQMALIQVSELLYIINYPYIYIYILIIYVYI